MIFFKNSPMARLFGEMLFLDLKPPASGCRNWPSNQKVSFMEST